MLNRRAPAAVLDAWRPHRYGPRRHPQRSARLSVLKRLLTWWHGATPGTLNIIRKRAEKVGQDDYGNTYYEARRIIDGDAGRRRRYVVYKGYADASKVPAEWHGWLHHTFAEPPTIAPLKRRAWELDHMPNMTGTIYAYRPPGSIQRSGERDRATGDYQAWRPDALEAPTPSSALTSGE